MDQNTYTEGQYRGLFILVIIPDRDRIAKTGFLQKF